MHECQQYDSGDADVPNMIGPDREGIRAMTESHVVHQDLDLTIAFNFIDFFRAKTFTGLDRPNAVLR